MRTRKASASDALVARAEADLEALVAARPSKCHMCRWGQRSPERLRYVDHLAAKVGDDPRVSWNRIAALARAAFGDDAPQADSIRRHYGGRCVTRE